MATPTRSPAYTTRFLASEDSHLRDHQKFLLGSRSNLALLQTTDDQYIVYLESPKPQRKPPPPKSAHAVPRQAKKKTKKPMSSPLRAASAHGLRKKRGQVEPLAEMPQMAQVTTPTKPLVRHRSASALGHRPSTMADETTKPTVNHLLESDMAYHEKVLALQKEIASLDAEKKSIDKSIDIMRKQLRGVHAVQENDQAVAHCLSVVQHRFNKAEEEYMKAVTQQAAVRIAIDYLRQELLSLGQVQRKLESDIQDARTKIIEAEERINTTREVASDTMNELAELERQAEADAVERVLKLPPEDNFVHMDVPRMMAFIHDRAAAREQALASMEASNAAAEASEKINEATELPLRHKVHFTTTFETIQSELDVPSIEAFVDAFVETETQLISLYKLDLEQQAEVKRFEDQLAALEDEAAQIQSSVHAADAAKAIETQSAQEKLRQAERKTQEYLELTRKRSMEHDALRAPILHLLEVLKTDKHVLQGNGYIAAVQDMPLPAILGIAQERIVEIAIMNQMTLKTKDSTRRDSNRNTKDPSPASAIVVGPRVPLATEPSPMSADAIGPFETLASAMVLPAVLTSDAAMDNSMPVSPDQLLQRALLK
ncbi:hypothetical protein SPRG_08617 [Saprolegnia parasitica CBS 223.65]|uniref:ODAD1 central coiled coil region domain-containing protein n=1 Tax=Saprolegnia parasitica (strain CBS 223.65) TaxID=695850 RepID=A0A067C598_SAPPC|nr:hypothetical protein SPRG_08617 [Saprolegnia parasitica CBS 223.65]KDO25964.1 hypothetical protein SPRG_08617 [Saprolegnia parasitica CBS 223.65]|eukprot:XP_012203251.1 hypothetical protein SPRG_08617 [Saprolegnia parasitica CBS 223.65]